MFQEVRINGFVNKKHVVLSQIPPTQIPVAMVVFYLSMKLTACRLFVKMDGWKMIVSSWGLAYTLED